MATERQIFITREQFCRDLESQVEDLESFSSIEEIYDLVFDQLAHYLQEGNTRVYLPMIGTLYCSPVPANPASGLPERLRYRLSCKPFPKH